MPESIQSLVAYPHFTLGDEMQRIASRPQECICIHLNCDDYRLLLNERRIIWIGAVI